MRGFLTIVVAVVTAVIVLGVALVVGTVRTEPPPERAAPSIVHVAPSTSPQAIKGNCLTEHRCGPGYLPVNQLPNPRFWITAIHDEHPSVNPRTCQVKIADTSVIVCPDGWTITS